ncbi:MAG: DUF2189 domain-containing protein [Betaproteobacteria bacterium]|nr:DUF2189 domain-containing protein [Betaproteobacteria bacterium]
MEKAHFHFERHATLPEVADVRASRPLQWLRDGWQDLARNPLPSLAYGLILAVAGWVILAFASGHPYLFVAAVSGFLLVGPLLAAGLYELSRRQAAGEPANFDDSLDGLRPHRGNLLQFGLVLALLAIAWERLSALMFGLFFDGDVRQVTDLAYRAFFSWEDTGFLMAYTLVGAVLALLVLAIAAVSVPMIMDRGSDVVTAMLTSAKAVGINPVAMLVWTALIVVLTLVGFATLLIGLVVIIPLLGHATWHAYTDLVRR